MNPRDTSKTKSLEFVKYTNKRYKSEIERFLMNYSSCENPMQLSEGDSLIKGLSYTDAFRLKNMLMPYGCYTRISYGSAIENQNEEKLEKFLANGFGSLRCLRCGSSNYAPRHGLFGSHPSRWSCKDCSWTWEY